MSHNPWFEFKKFRIIQEKSAMKVNTDGVLLGAWVNVEGAETVLDIGAGTGVISLMIAQRSENAQITAVEIEKSASEEAVQNVLNSEWSKRITVLNCSFQDFSGTSSNKFDVILSNPPFFVNSKKSKNPQLSIARHNHLLAFEDIIEGTEKLLNDKGKLAVILPVESAEEFIEKAARKSIFLTRTTEVKPFPDKKPNRVLMEFERKKKPLQKNLISVYNESRKEYAEEFKNIVSEFYIKL